MYGPCAGFSASARPAATAPASVAGTRLSTISKRTCAWQLRSGSLQVRQVRNEHAYCWHVIEKACWWKADGHPYGNKTALYCLRHAHGS